MLVNLIVKVGNAINFPVKKPCIRVVKTQKNQKKNTVITIFSDEDAFRFKTAAAASVS